LIQKLLGALLSLFCATALCAQTILLTVDGTFSDSQSGLISGTREVTISLNKNADLFVGNVGSVWAVCFTRIAYRNLLIDYGVR
jgi:hypothetical protein